MPRKQFRLVTLGRLALEGPAGDDDSLGKRRLKLALLAFLALTRKPWPRDVLADLFWGERSEENARHSLSDALSHLRQALGKDAITQRQADVALAADAPLSVDVDELDEAVQAGDFDAAIGLHGGAFLEGVHVADSTRFEDWRSKQQLRVESLIARAEAGLAARPRLVVADAVPPAPAAHAPPPLSVASPTRAWRRRVPPLAVALLAGVVIVAGTLRYLSARAPATDGVPVVAIAEIDNVRGDTSLAWLEEGLKQMIAASLARSPQLQVVSPALVREAARDAPVADRALTVARRTGARLAVQGGFTRGPDTYVLDLTIRDVARGKPVASFTVSALDPIAMADAASARILASTASVAAGPQLSEVETSSARAYQLYVQAVQEIDAGHLDDATTALDAALAQDSLFVSAVLLRLDIALSRDDRRLAGALVQRFLAFQERATDWDRLRIAHYVALHNGESARAEALARDAVRRYPRDPRAYQQLLGVLLTHGNVARAESVATQLIALDAQSVPSPHGLCAQCAGWSALAGIQGFRGDLVSAERSIRHLVSLQPDAPRGYDELATVLSYAGKHSEAIAAVQRARALSSDATYEDRLLHARLNARELDAVDAATRGWRVEPDPVRRSFLTDLHFTLERERGRYRSEVVEQASHELRDFPVLVHADNLARTGDVARARAILEGTGHDRVREEELGPFMRYTGDLARGFAWPHALLADMLSRNGADTATLLALADSIEREGANSYYGRDWRLHHHVRGLVAARGGRWDEAEHEFQAARWGAAGWTRTVQLLAEAQARRQRPLDAIRTLRDAYQGPLDAMGRYVPRSELDFDMARYFAAAGMADSARAYSNYVRAAWAGADADVRSRLAALPRD